MLYTTIGTGDLKISLKEVQSSVRMIFKQILNIVSTIIDMSRGTLSHRGKRVMW